MEARDYLTRIGALLDRSISVAHLDYLHERHLLSVPFENIDIHVGKSIVLDEDRILDKIVRRRRGGFCYELNSAFRWLLLHLGYQVDMLAGEVAREGGGYGIPFDHMALLVHVGGESWLADVGFGESFVHPIPMSPGTLHEESEHRYRLGREGGYWVLERASRGSDVFAPQYRFTTVPRELSDFRDGCRYHQTSPESHFTRKAIATLALADGRVTLAPDRLIVRRGGERVETPIPDDSRWREALDRYFGIALEKP